VRPTSRAETKVGLSDATVPSGRAVVSTDKSFPGDNGPIPPERSYRQRSLVPRRRLAASWGCRRSQGLAWFAIKAVCELGFERRESVRISIRRGRRKLEESCPKYERNRVGGPIVCQLSRQGHSWIATFAKDKH